MKTPDPLLDAAAEAVRGFMLATDRFRRAMSGHFNIGTSEALVLSHLRNAGGQLTPREIGERMMLTSGTLTAILDRLTAQRLITRIPNPEDRRSVLVTLNPAGRRVLDYTQRRMEHAVVTAFGDDLSAQVPELLWRIASALDQEADPPETPE
jgi:DNA-binding MarR family transcriptional regulator